ncbi:MAG: HAMP domain-containing protein [Gammaproteobacteria bacterium]|nr:HAMP domain-containing protein [Gammaproteobacteria bacterium]
MPLLLGSLRGKFVFWMSAVFTISLLLAFGAFRSVSDTIIIALGDRFAEKQALYDKSRIRAPVQKEIVLARKMADSVVLQRWAEAENDPQLKASALKELDSYRQYFFDGSVSFIIDKSGHYYFNNKHDDFSGQELRYTLDRSAAEDHWYYQIRQLSFPYTLHVAPDQHLNMTKMWVDVPIRSASGQFLGLIRAGIQLKDFINDFIRNNEDGITNILIDGDGAIQAHPDSSLIDMSSNSNPHAAHFTIFNLLNLQDDHIELQAALDALRMVPTQVQTLYLTIQGERKLVGIAYMPDLQWFNITVMDIDTLLGEHTFTPMFMVLVAALLFSLLAVAGVLQFFVLRRIAGLDSAARKVAGGHYDVQLSNRENDELGRLASGFNHMAATIRDNTAKLEHRVAERTAELQRVNDQLALKNKQILDSIRYAKLIQTAILPRSDLIARYLQDHLVIWLPRDVVGGDFYFLHPAQDGSCFLGLVDCTGHGIPGAFMTMTAHAVLRQVLSESDGLPLSSILALMDERLRQTLQHTSEGDALDYGMDIAICRLNTGTLEYAGCGIDLCLVDKGASSIIKATHRGLGYRLNPRKVKPIEIHHIKFDEQCRFYLVSDGLLDQDGGEDGFGFGRERFLNQIAGWADLPMNQQQTLLVELLERYRGQRVQRDDITVFGFSAKNLSPDEGI